MVCCRRDILVVFLMVMFNNLSAQTFYKWSDPVNVSTLNSPADEFAPSWNNFEYQLYFNSTITGYSLFYTSRLLDSATFSKAEAVRGPINTTNSNQSYISFMSEDRAILNKFRQGVSRSYFNLYNTSKKKNEWTIPILADSLGLNAFAGHSTVSPDGSFIIFSSDLKSDKMDLDLWIAYRQENGTWGAVSAVNELNTTGNEITPFLVSDDTLYFSSTGQEGPGGYDLFYSVRSQGIWQRPNPLTELNTKFNESDFIIIAGNYAVFASDRPGGRGNLDLYVSRKEEVVFKRQEEIPDMELNIAVQVSTVRSQSDISYKPLPLLFYFSPAENYFFKNKGEIRVLKNTMSFDSLNQYIPSFVGYRLLNNPGVSLKIIKKVSAGNNEAILDSLALRLKDYLLKTWNIDESRITEETRKTKTQQLIILDSEEPKIFEPLVSHESTISLDPSALDVSFNARPNSILKSWSCDLIIDKETHPDIKTSNKAPEQFTIQLKDFNDHIPVADSMILAFKVTDTLGRIVTRDYFVNIAHSETRARILKTTDGKVYEQIWLQLIDSVDVNTINSFIKTVEWITSGIQYSHKCKVVYFALSAASKAETLLQAIKSRLAKPDLNIKTEYVNYHDSLPFSLKNSGNFFEILIEKVIQN